ncbi:MAG: sugar-binding domain-containing protein, partial [Clostridia bacterium]
MEKLITRWGKELNQDSPLQEYPRPQMVRESYTNLNGLWDYAILPKSQKLGKYQGKIVVPFSPETILSGVEKNVTEKDFLYYQKKFNFKKTKDIVLLHFGAVDYECEVSLNGKLVGKHKGGYYPFYFDITKNIINGENKITLRVSDPSDKGEQARGKQKKHKGGIWYTPQSGIWQTVWIEEVVNNFIDRIKITPNIDDDTVAIEPIFKNEFIPYQVIISDNGTQIVKKMCKDKVAIIKLEDYNLWSPENPYLYDLEIFAGDDQVVSYFGMRKFGIGYDSKGITRMTLNNKPYFQNGLLDQGYWSDGLYTAPSDDAMIYDIATMKEMGFNMLRKHIKLEPLRWYYHCDKFGMIVWQDMISGGSNYSNLTIGLKPFLGLCTFNKKIGHMNDGKKNYRKFSRNDDQGRKEYYVDSQRLIDTLY